MNLLADIEQFIITTLGSYISIDSIQHDASTRRYYRVKTIEGNYILCYDENLIRTNLEEYAFLNVYNLFRKHMVPVPEVYTIDSEKGFILQQDLGDQLLENSPRVESPSDTQAIYRACIDILLNIQEIEFDGSIPFHLAFDMEKLMFEFNFFIEHALVKYKNVKLGAKDAFNLNKSFLAISEMLQKTEAFVLTHRDYHCRNIMLDKNRPYVIDFQDARMGLPQYDLSSLLRDPYQKLDGETFKYLIDYYYKASLHRGIHAFGMDEFLYYFDVMAFQRLIKAIGTYGYQTISKQSNRYVASIETATAYLREIAVKHPVLSGCWQILSPYFDAC